MAIALLAGVSVAGASEREALLSEAETRERAEALVRELATAEEDELDRIERELAELGPTAMVALRLGELGDSFEMRRRSAVLADRVRWRLVASDQLLTREPTLLETMAGEDARARAALVDSVSTSPLSTALPFLRECLSDGQAYVRHRAVDGLTNLASQHGRQKREVVAVLETTLTDRGDRDLQVLGISALTRLKAVDVKKLAELLDHDAPEVRRSAIRALGFSGNGAAAEHILPRLKDSQWRVRAAALEALRELSRQLPNRSAVVEQVVPLLADEDGFVRANAAALLARVNDPASAKALLEAMDSDRLDAATGLEALASMEAPAGRDRLIERFEQDEALEDRRRWLELLANYREDAKAKALFRRILDDDEQRDLWLEAIQAVRYQEGYAATLAEKLMDQDDRIAHAAWQGMSYHFHEHPLPEAQLDALWEIGSAERQSWVLHYSYEHDDQAQRWLLRALQQDEAELANLALGMLSELHTDDGLDVSQIPSRRTTHEVFYGNTMRGAMMDELPGADATADDASADDDAWHGAVLALLDHEQAELATRAAALLYRAGRRDEMIVNRLRTALQSDQPNLQRLGLAAMASDHEPLSDAADLEALADQPATGMRAVGAMVATGDRKYLPRLIALAEDADPTAHDLTAALVRFGGEEAMAVAKARAAAVSQWEIEDLGLELAGMEGPEPVAVIQALWDRKDLDNWQRGELVPVLSSFDDASVQPLLEAALRLAQQGEIWVDIEPVRSRLHELDPEAAARALAEALKSEDLYAQSEAIDQLLAVEPSDRLIASALDAAQIANTAASNWRGVAEWLPLSAVYESYLPEFGQLNEQLRLGLAQRLAKSLDERGLALVLEHAPDQPTARTLLAMVLAQWFIREPERVPALEDQSEAGLALLLEALASHEQAVQRITPYLADEREAVAMAGGRGLALHLLGHGMTDAGAKVLDDVQRERLLAMVIDEEPYTAYLAAEALLHIEPTALRTVDAAQVTTDAAAMRVAVAHAQTDTLSADLARRIRSALRSQQGPTPMRLAMAGLIALPDDTPPLPVLDHQAIYQHADLLRELAERPGQERLLVTLLEQGLATLDAPAFGGRVEPLRERASRVDTEGNRLFAMLASHGLVTPSGADDVLRLLRMVGRDEKQYHGPWQFEQHGTIRSPLSLALAWADDESDEQVLARMNERTISGVSAAVVAAIAWQDTNARELLLRAATAEPRKRHDYTQEIRLQQALALRSLAASASPDQIDALIAYEATLVGEPYDHALQTLRELVRQTLAVHRPGHVRDLLAAEPVEPDPWGRPMLSLDDLHLQFADAEGWPGQVDSSGDRSWLLSQVLAARQQVEKEADDNEPAHDWSELLPPWSTSAQAAQWGTSMHTAMPVTPDEQQKQEREQWRTWIVGNVDDADDTMLNARYYAEQWAYEAGWGGSDGHWNPLDSEDPAAHYLGSSQQWRGSSNTLSQRQWVDLLEPLLDHDQSDVRRRAMRAAGSWQVMALAETIADRLEADDRLERVEAAWALASLQGQAATEAVRERFDRSDSFDERVMLAVVLRLLGDTTHGQAELARAHSLDRMLRVQHRILTIASSETTPRRGGGLLSQLFGGGDAQAAEPYHQLINQLPDGGATVTALPWQHQLTYIADDRERALRRRLALAAPSITPVATPSSSTALTADLSRLSIDQSGRLMPPVHLALPTPVTPLADTSPMQAPPFARLIAAEQHLEAIAFVQFAHEAEDLLDLRDRWRAWWQEHAEAGHDAWWRQAVEQALVELEDERWWHRMRGARRLGRLTGRTTSPANPFDPPQWQSFVQDWQTWWASAQSDSPQAIVLQQGVAAGVLPAEAMEAALAEADEQEAMLAMLVRLAEQDHLAVSDAALLQLLRWPHVEALHRTAALAWQSSRQPLLADWARQQAHTITGRYRLRYTRADFRLDD